MGTDGESDTGGGRASAGTDEMAEAPTFAKDGRPESGRARGPRGPGPVSRRTNGRDVGRASGLWLPARGESGACVASARPLDVGTRIGPLARVVARGRSANATAESKAGPTWTRS